MTPILINTNLIFYFLIVVPSQSEADAMWRAMLEANLSSEVAVIVLDIVSLYTVSFKVCMMTFSFVIIR